MIGPPGAGRLTGQPRPRFGSRLAQDQVHRPAAADVWPRPTKVVQNLGVGAASFFEGVGEDRQSVERPVGVDDLW
jgi:hypothetical protein